MKSVSVPGDGGGALACIEHNGFLLPNFPEPNGIESLGSVKIRDDDVIIATFPKCGTHWVFEITRELLLGEIFKDKKSMASSFMELVPEKVLDDLPSPRILSTHVLMEQLPVDVKKKNPKIIVVLRNPKDVAVSFYNFLKKIGDYDGNWENFLRPFGQGKFIYGSWFDYLKNWDKAQKENPDLPILRLFYEDMKEDPIREMKKICKFLGVERDEDFLEKVQENTSLQTMRTMKDMKTLFRKGEVGDWKNWFTVAQNEWFDQVYQKEMSDSPLSVKFQS